MMQGMDSPDERSYGYVDAESEEDAIEKIVLREYPEDKMYGPDMSYSSRGFLRSCLSAQEKSCHE